MMRRVSSAESLSTHNLFDWSKNRFRRVRKRLVELRSWATMGSVSDDDLPSRSRPVAAVHDDYLLANHTVTHGTHLNAADSEKPLTQSRAPKHCENLPNGATHKQQVRKFFSRLADSGNAKAKTDTREMSEHPYSYENNALELHEGDMSDSSSRTCNCASGTCENCQIGNGSVDTSAKRPAGQQQAETFEACECGEEAEKLSTLRVTVRKSSTPPVPGAAGEAAKVQKKARIKLPACALKMPPFEQEVNIACQTAIGADGTVRHMFASVPAPRPAVELCCCAAHQLGLCTDQLVRRAATPMMTHRMRVAWASRRRHEKRPRVRMSGVAANGSRDGTQWTCYAVFGPETTPRDVGQPAHCASPLVDAGTFASRNTAPVGGVRTQSLAAEVAFPGLSLGPSALNMPTDSASTLDNDFHSSKLWTDTIYVTSHAQLNPTFKAKLRLAASYRLPRPLSAPVPYA